MLVNPFTDMSIYDRWSSQKKEERRQKSRGRVRKSEDENAATSP